jgi:hypothetical protein
MFARLAYILPMVIYLIFPAKTDNKRNSNILAHILQHATQAGLFIFSSVLILNKDWCSTHAAFVILQASAHFMKMHSYTTVNRDYREQK